ncbi:winged helix-turn-helix domain-containing protein [Lysinibacillus fusiformis]|uniref:winged helix-turn-helix domain-containing protein n=1 Tax=Lysinibacillus fusiformis TaxID=28031 RepID=UPI003019417D
MNFEKQFNRTRKTISVFSKRFSYATNIPIEEYESAMCEEFAKKYYKYDGRIPFDAYIKPVLHQCAQKVASRKERKFYDSVIHVDGIIDEDCNPKFEFVSDVDIENEVVSPIKKCEDKLQLIHALISQADDITTAIVNHMLENPNASMRSIARDMGVHPSKISRCITRLAKNYDSKRFGDVSQYLAV